MPTNVNRVNGRLQKWDTVVEGLRDLGVVRTDFSGQVTVHFAAGRPTKYEMREIRHLSVPIDTNEDKPVNCGK